MAATAGDVILRVGLGVLVIEILSGVVLAVISIVRRLREEHGGTNLDSIGWALVVLLYIVLGLFFAYGIGDMLFTVFGGR